MTTSFPNKICRVMVNDESVLVREDGQEWPESRYIYPDESGECWLWDGPKVDDFEQNPCLPSPQ